MKTLSCIHSFAVFLAFSVITFQSSFALPDLKAGAILQPRLDGSAVTSGPANPTRRRNRCSFTPPSEKGSATASVYSTGTIASASITTGSPLDFPGSNGSTLATHLHYSTSLPCKPETGTVYLQSPSGTHSAMASAVGQQSSEGSPGITGIPPSNSEIPKPNDNAGSGLPMAGNDGPSPPVAMAVSSDAPNSNKDATSDTITRTSTGGSSKAASSVPGSLGNGDGTSPPAGSGSRGSLVSAGSPGVCGPQVTVIVTTRYTVTVTQAAEAANTAGVGNAATSGAPSINGAAAPTSTGIDSETSTGPFANASTGRGRMAFSKATGNGSASASSDVGGLYGNGTQGTPVKKAAMQPSAHYASPCPSPFP